MNGPCTWPVRSLYTAVYTGHKHVHVHSTRPRTRAVNTAVSIGSRRPFTGRVLYTGRKHGRVQGTRPCTRPCSGHGRTMHGRVHGTYTAVHMGRKDGRVHRTARARPCIRYEHGRVRAAYPAVFCHVPAAYTAVFGTRTDHVHGPCTAMYTVCARPRAAVHTVDGRVRAVYTAVIGSRTDHVHGPYAVCTQATNTCMYTVHGRVHVP